MIELLKAGLYDSIQDLGRFSLQQFGVPFSGAMDQYSAKLGNLILGNHHDAAVLEWTLLGPNLKCHSNALICVTGAICDLKINKHAVKQNMALRIQAGDTLTFGAAQKGCRGYLAVLGGFQTELVMGSRSQYANITAEFRLKKGTRLPIKEQTLPKLLQKASVKTPTAHFDTKLIEVFKGPEYDALSETQQRALTSKTFTVSKDSNRMAYQFNERFENELEPIITSLVLPGSVQLTPSGQLVILMRDCQTTGGYPRVLQLSEQAIDRLAQKNFGAEFRFEF
jgi:biotin-dependent carboxylase-like uncharacterized protein